MAWSITQRVAVTTAVSGATIVLTVTSTTGPIIVPISNSTGGYIVTGVADNRSNTYLQYGSGSAHANDDSFTGKHTDCWHCLSPISGVTTVTVTLNTSGTQQRFVVVYELGGVTAAIEDVGNVANDQNYASDPCLGPSATTTGGGTGFAVGIVSAQFGISANPTSGNEFTSGGDLSTDTNQGIVSLLNPSSASHRPSWDGSIGHGCASMAAFKEAGGPSQAQILPALVQELSGQMVGLVYR